MGVQKRVYEIAAVAANGDRVSRIFDISILALIALNVLALILETVEPIYNAAPQVFIWFEIVSVTIFTIEYIMRLWSCVQNARYRSPITGRLRYALRPMLLVDLVAVLPFYLPWIGVDLRFVRSIRMFRLFRIAKVARYSNAVKTIARVIHAKRAELMVTLFVLVLVLILASSMMYFAEHDAQPETFSSIPAAMWWAVATLTTVGYGDVYPVTAIGKLIGCVIAIAGIGMFALPTGILGAAFAEEVQRQKTEPQTVICPHCGEEVEQ
jgi:voltage-gated potassium channel